MLLVSREILFQNSIVQHLRKKKRKREKYVIVRVIEREITPTSRLDYRDLSRSTAIYFDVKDIFSPVAKFQMTM